MLSNAPDVLCFACPCLLAYFREATNLCCAHEASPYFLLEGGPCLPGLPAQNICYQATARPVPLQSGVVYTPSGSISQQHCITLTGFPHLTERNLIGLFSPANQNVSYPHTTAFLSATQQFPSVFVCCSRWPFRATKLKLRRRLFMKKLCLTWLSAQPLAKNIPEAYSYMICQVRVQVCPCNRLITHLFSSKSSNSFLAKSKAFLHAYVNTACVYCISWNTTAEIKKVEPCIAVQIEP